MRGQYAFRHEVAEAIVAVVIPAGLGPRGRRLNAFDRHNPGEQRFHF